MEVIILSIFTSQWRVFLFCLLLLVFAAEIGFRMGISSKRVTEKHFSLINSCQASVLGLLALLLGFSFSMAVNRYDVRRDLVVQEANSIGTTYLRADFLPSPQRQAVHSLLHEYVHRRLDFSNFGQGEIDLLKVERASGEIHRLLWGQVAEFPSSANTPLTALFVTALNQTIDLDATRLAALRNHVPLAVWVLLVFVAFSGAAITGYNTGVSGRRIWLSQFLLPVLIATVITLLVDIDSPRRGLIGISQQSLLELDHLLGTDLRKSP